jgi:cold shock CspA family protein
MDPYYYYSGFSDHWYKEILNKYGFIINDEDKKDVFVHLNELKRACINELIKGDKVRFELKTKDSKIYASNIELI